MHKTVVTATCVSPGPAYLNPKRGCGTGTTHCIGLRSFELEDFYYVSLQLETDRNTVASEGWNEIYSVRHPSADSGLGTNLNACQNALKVTAPMTSVKLV